MLGKRDHHLHRMHVGSGSQGADTRQVDRPRRRIAGFDRGAERHVKRKFRNGDPSWRRVQLRQRGF